MDYCDLLISMLKGTETRHVFDRALQSLPITQHKKIWEMYITWAKEFGVSETTVRVYRRYLMYDQSNREDFVSYLEEINLFGEAARQLSLCVDDDKYISPQGHTKHQMWMRLCDICSNNPDEVSSILKVDSIIRSGISKFSDEVGKLWSKLADYYVRLGQFERSRDIYEEAINAVTTVRDFTIIFDSYVKVEESVVTAKLTMMQQEQEEEGVDGEDGELKSEIELSMSRLEYLMDKRPLLLSSVILRQNPHNVHEWHKRLKLFNNDIQRKLMTYVEAVKTVDPKKSNGKLSSLWLSFARFYEKQNDIDNARTIYKKATDINYKNDDELANIWCAWGEMELRHDNFDEALSVMQQSVMEPVSAIKKRHLNSSGQSEKKSMNIENYEGAVCSDRIYKNVKVWGLFLDLEESLGTVETCRAAYDRCLELKVITAQMTLNYAQYLEENNFFEDSFKVYEQGVYLFTYPQVKKVWLVYLDKFMERYKGNKLERLRDLFEKSIKNVPTSDSAELYIKYAKAEETYGLVRHSIDVYDRATRIVPEESKLDMYRLYIKKVEQHYGVTKTRSVYERAISELNDDMSREICLQFSQMETKLGEIDRARAILIHGSQFADVRREPSYWQQWRAFEESHGNEDTFRDMLRIQRSVEIAFSQVKYYLFYLFIYYLIIYLY
jgi:pre-mRNA-splicing factor SYF1